MTKAQFFMLLKRKLYSLLLVSLGALVIAAVITVLAQLAIALGPKETMKSIHATIMRYFHDPAALKATLLDMGANAPWVFIMAQVLQVVIAPIPGQIMAMAGGFVFGFWKGWLYTTLGLALGSFAAMALSRLLGWGFVRKFFPARLLERFDEIISGGGYTTFFMIFLLPALPDDAVCFMAGLTKLKLLPLSLVCLLGRAPGMAVLSLVGAGIATGLTPAVKLLFGTMMLISLALWIFWEIIEEKIYSYLHISRE